MVLLMASPVFCFSPGWTGMDVSLHLTLPFAILIVELLVSVIVEKLLK